MDERRLSELLKDAVADAPPATFGVTEVAAESERQRVRHRNGLLAGSALGVAMLAGATALGVALWTGPDAPTEATSAGGAASGSNEDAAPYEVPDEDNKAAPQTESGGDQEVIPPESPKQGGTSDGNAGSAGPGSAPSGCEQADRELAAALAGELPAAANVKLDDARPVQFTCPNGSRGAAFLVSGGATGEISVILVRPDVSSPAFQTDDGSVRAEARTDAGTIVIAISEPRSAGENAPYGADLQRIAVELAKINP
jgi:hypothetical protein